VAPDQLLAHVLGDRAKRTRIALLEQQREEVDLEEHVAELVEQLGVVARVRGGRQLVGLLDRVRHDRALVLLAIPGTLLAQAAGERVKALDRRCGVLGAAQLAGVGVGCAGTVPPPAGAVGVGVAFGAFLQSCVR
jgi:hypothetical protein